MCKTILYIYRILGSYIYIYYCHYNMYIYILYTHIICVIMFIYAQIDPIDPIPIYRDDLLHDIF